MSAPLPLPRTTCGFVCTTGAIPKAEEKDWTNELATVKAGGAEIIEVDKTSFQNAMKPVYDKFITDAKLKDLVKRIIHDHLEDVQHNRLPAIHKRTGAGLDEITRPSRSSST